MLGGCASGRQASDSPGPVRSSALTYKDFVGSGPANDAPANPAAEDGAPISPRAALPETNAGGPRDPVSGGDRVSDAAPRTARPLRAGDRVIVDSLVGQVNGRPIFADTFFEPIADELVAASRESTPAEFTERAGEIVQRELQNVLINALFIAEAESRLSAEQKQGLFAWLKDVTARVTAERGGSTELAQQDLARTESATLEQYVGRVRDEALIRNLIAERIEPRIIVAWRDVVRAYDRQHERFIPRASVTLARIRLRTQSDALRIAEVEQRLAAGEPFAQVADAMGEPSGGEWQKFDVGAGGSAEIELADPALDAAVASLTQPGQVAGPVEVGNSTWWVQLSAYDRPEALSLYDPLVQRALASEIRAERYGQEQRRYVQTLLEKGIYDELDLMGQRLLAIAVARYGP